MTTHENKVLRYMRENGSATIRDIALNLDINCPYSVIRNLRKKLGYDAIPDEEVEKTKKTLMPDGTLKSEKIKYKRYFLREQTA